MDAEQVYLVGVQDRHTVIRTVNLTKVYGSTVALSDVSVDIKRGDIYGLIGPNGAGKTTLIKILATLCRPTRGTAYVCGHSVESKGRAIAWKIGYMPDQTGVYADVMVSDYLEFFAVLYHLPEETRRRTIGYVVEVCGLRELLHSQIRTLSKGQQQRLELGRVLLHDPEVLFLDEPASGLDPGARIEMLQLLRVLQQNGKTVLISSHILAELGKVSNAIGILEKGKLLYSGSVREAIERVAKNAVWRVRTEGDLERAKKILEEDPRVAQVLVSDQTLKVKFHPGPDGPCAAAEKLVAEKFPILEMAREEVDLEDVFLQITSGIVS